MNSLNRRKRQGAGDTGQGRPPAPIHCPLSLAPYPMKIIRYPHPTLRHVSKPLKRIDAELHAIVRRMFELMYEHKGVGLAANQVDLPYRLFIVNLKGKVGEG